MGVVGNNDLLQIYTTSNESDYLRGSTKGDYAKRSAKSDRPLIEVTIESMGKAFYNAVERRLNT